VEAEFGIGVQMKEASKPININILTIIKFSGITTHNPNSFWTDTFALLAAAKVFHFTL
jgi:hypothetical protein